MAHEAAQREAAALAEVRARDGAATTISRWFRGKAARTHVQALRRTRGGGDDDEVSVCSANPPGLCKEGVMSPRGLAL